MRKIYGVLKQIDGKIDEILFLCRLCQERAAAYLRVWRRRHEKGQKNWVRGTMRKMTMTIMMLIRYDIV